MGCRVGHDPEQTKGEIPMSMKVNPVPEGMRTVTPHLVCAGASDAIEFYRKAFGAEEVARLPGRDGRLMHAEIRIGDSAIMLVDEMPEHGVVGPAALASSPVTIHLYVADADAVVARAAANGATVTMPPADMFWGDRYGRVRDPFGHHWSIATHRRDVPPEEWARAMESEASR
jgi:uncharacterized glyoxalase superfamily protein PhnB